MLWLYTVMISIWLAYHSLNSISLFITISIIIIIVIVFIFQSISNQVAPDYRLSAYNYLLLSIISKYNSFEDTLMA